MTLPPEMIGDNGQRFEVRYKPRVGPEKVFGWSNTMEGAEQLLGCVKIWPAAVLGKIIDRGAQP